MQMAIALFKYRCLTRQVSLYILRPHQNDAANGSNGESLSQFFINRRCRSEDGGCTIQNFIFNMRREKTTSPGEIDQQRANKVYIVPN